MKFFWVLGLITLRLGICVHGFDFKEWNVTEVGNESNGSLSKPLFVVLTLIPFAASKGAVCTDGSLPGYHLHRGFGSGANNWLVNLEGGGWCNNLKTCVYRKKSRHGSSNYMEKEIQFTGIMSDKPEENPDFFDWNRVKVRYCDGASFTGEAYNKQGDLYFRGQRIWQVAMEEIMSKGMNQANQALLSGCSAGGLASIQHCDDFRALFPTTTKVKCLSDAGLFLDALDVAGGRTLRSFFDGVVTLQGSGQNLPRTCTSQMDGTSLLQSLAPDKVDPHGYWLECKHNHLNCNEEQIQFLQGFRDQMLNAVKGFSMAGQNGLFINSCFAHCQMERQDTWFASNSPQIGNKGIAKAVGDWYFDRAEVKAIDCPYPCDNTCHDLVFRGRS